MKINALLFDFGGTIDTDGLHWSEVLWAAYGACGIEVEKTAFREAYVWAERAMAAYPFVQPGHAMRRMLYTKLQLELQYLAAQRHIDYPISVLLRKAESVARHADESVRHNLQCVRPMLEQLAERYKLVLVTNFYGNMHSVLRAYALDRYFAAVIESAVVGVRKPDAEMFRLGLQAAGVSASQAVVIGDSVKNDILPAAGLGCRTIWLEGKGWDDAVRSSASPDAIIHHLTELPDALRRMAGA